MSVFGIFRHIPEFINRFQFTGIQVFVQVIDTIIGDAVQPAIDLLEEPVLDKLPTAGAGMLTDWPAEVFDCLGGKVPVFSDNLENTVIGGNHPVRLLTHCVFCVIPAAHRFTDTNHLTTKGKEFTADGILTIYKRQ